MPRLKNVLNVKDRKTQVVQTSGSVTYKIPIGEEKESLGHFISQEIIDGMLVIRYATKSENTHSVIMIENRPMFSIDFS